MVSENWSVDDAGGLVFANTTGDGAWMTPEDARAFAGAILDASVRAERAAKEAERG